jgi:hypothetical protein
MLRRIIGKLAHGDKAHAPPGKHAQGIPAALFVPRIGTGTGAGRLLGDLTLMEACHGTPEFR